MNLLLFILTIGVVLLFTVTVYAVLIQLYCKRQYKLLLNSVGVAFFCAAYYILFNYGFSYLSLIQVLFVIIYSAGLKYRLSNDLSFQLSQARLEAREKLDIELEEALKAKGRSLKELEK